MTYLERRIADLGPWFHNLRLDGIETAPDHPLGDYPNFKWKGFRSAVPEDLRGRSVLDIGCNAGFYSLEMASRGAERVLAIDHDARYLEQARLAAEVSGAAIEFRQMSVYEVGDLNEEFDLVLFMGVFYHLRYPLLALDLLRRHVVARHLLFQSMQRGDASAGSVDKDYSFDDVSPFGREDWPKLHFFEHRYAGDPTNWFIPNRSAVEAMLRSAGFSVLQHPEQEVYLCGLSPHVELAPPFRITRD